VFWSFGLLLASVGIVLALNLQVLICGLWHMDLSVCAQYGHKNEVEHNKIFCV